MPVSTTKVLLDSAVLGGGGFTDTARAVGDLLNPLPGVASPGGIDSVTLNTGATSFETLLIGAPGDDDNLTDAGRAFVVLNEALASDERLGSRKTEIIITGVAAGDAAGADVAALADLNGDGISEFAVGAPGVDAGTAGDAGRTYVVWGQTTAGGINLANATAGGRAGYSIDGEAAGDRAGASIAAMGDLNGDGKAEILIGAAGNDEGGVDAGAAYVVWGRSGGDVALSSVAAGAGGFKIIGENAGDAAGSAVAQIADLNGDGKGDVLIGATGNDSGGADAGAVYVVYGKGDGSPVNLDDVAAGLGGFKIEGVAGGQIGQTVTSIGDVNGDGKSDILIGDGAGNRSYVVFGKGDGSKVSLADVANGIGGFSILAEHAGDLTNVSVAGGKDLNGDGIADFVIGASHNNEGGAEAGAVYVVWGGGTGTVDLSLIAQSMGGAKIVGSAGSQTGSSVAILGDINHDGRADLAIGEGALGRIATLFTPIGLWLPDTNVYGTEGADVMDLGYGSIHKIGEGADNVLAAAGDDWIATHGGDDTLDGGTGADTMLGGLGNDLYYVDNAGDLTLENAGEGNDKVIASVSYTLAAGSEIERLQLVGAGLSGTGNELVNTIIGTSGNDTLSGGGGADTLIGGLGADTYVVGNDGVTIIEAATGGIDTVRASISVALQANVENLVLTGSLGLTGTGNELANQITGTSGNDVLDGGAGSDRLTGGLGDDTYLVDVTSDAVIESANGGHDTVIASVSGYVLAANAEDLLLAGNATSGMGNSGENVLTAGSLGATLDGAAGNDLLLGSALADTLIGGLGDDELRGGAGNDTLDGGAGSNVLKGGEGDDTYIVTSAADTVVEAAGEGTDTVVASTDYTLGAGSAIENLTLSGAAHNATGNELDNTITGNALDNVLDGGLGADTLIGGAGNDTYILAEPGDTIVELASGGTDTVIASFDYTLGAEVENLVLTGAARSGTGNDLDNALIGTAGNDSLSGGLGNDLMDGGAGADTMTGGLGDDTYVIDDAGDVVVENAGEGFDTVIVKTDWTLADNIEGVTLSGTGHSLTGNAADNRLAGDAGNDTLDGGQGNDIELGGDGNDRLVSSSGRDTLAGGSGDDTYVLHGGSAYIEDFLGHDAVDASEAYGNSYIDLSGGTRSQVEDQYVDFGTGGTLAETLNVQFLQDLTGSFADDIGTVRTLVPQIVSALQTIQASTEFGVSTFRDKAISFLGNAGDWVYTTQLALSTNTSALGSAYAAMVASGGADGPEAQLEALMQLGLRATSEVGYQSNAARFVVLFTDAPFHNAGDGASAGITTANNGDAILDGNGIGEDYPIIGQVRAALEAANIIPIFAIAGGFEATYQGLADALGRGSVVTLTANSSNIISAIVNGLTAATTTHIADATGGAGDDTLIGNVGDNMLAGNDGDDSLSGGLGNDTLVGGAGNDHLNGGAGSNHLDGGNGYDIAAYANASSAYTISILSPGTVSITNIAAGTTDTLVNVEVATFADGAIDLATGLPLANAAPVVNGPVTASAIEGGAAVTAAALANASDADSAALSIIVVETALPAGVTYDPLTQSFTIDPANAAYNSLAEGQALDVTVNYGVSDGFSTTGASVVFTITGTNDAPVVSGPLSIFANEGGAATAVSALAHVTDVDSATLDVIVDVAALPAGVSYDAVAKTFSLDPSASAFDSLARGETAQITVGFTVTDGIASTPHSVVFTVTGTNDAPLVSAAISGAVNEDQTLSLNALATASDVDSGTLHAVVDAAALPAGVSFDAATQTFSLDAAHAAYQPLAAGEQVVVTIDYAVSDGLVSTPASMSFTVTGTNDAPVVSGAVSAAATENGAPVSLSALAAASDIDSVSLSAIVEAAALPAGVSFDAATQSFTLDPTHPAYLGLGAGHAVDVVIHYAVTDGTDSSPASVVFTVNGINHAPVVSGAVLASATEGSAAVAVDALANASDSDGTPLTVVFDAAALPAGVTYDAATHSFALDPANAAYDALAQGQVQQVTVSYKVSDGLIETPASAVFTLTGTNDAPVVSGAVSATAAEGAAPVSLPALANASDPDSATLTAVVDAATLPPGVSFNAATQSFSFDPRVAAYNALAQGEIQIVTVNYGVTDGLATSQATATFTVTGTNDAPVVSGAVMATATEGGASITVSALANASDVDSTGLAAVVSGGLPAGVTYNAATQSFTFDPANAAYASLYDGQTAKVVVNYLVSDGIASTAASVEFTVNGVGTPPGMTVIGTAGNDSLTGGNGNDVIDGRAGADRMTGLAGDDTYVVDNAKDVVVEAAGAGNDSILSAVNHLLEANVENLTLTGSAGINGDGNDLDNVITGNAAANGLTGNAGNDHLTGGAGADKLSGGDGDDVLDGGTDGDTMDGGLGNDTFFVDSTADKVTDQAGTDSIVTTLLTYTLGKDIENLSFNGIGNFAGTGNASANVITGGAGADTLSGLAGSDTLNGGAGADVLTGGANADSFVFVMGQAAGDRVADFTGAGATVDDVLVFSGYGHGTITHIGTGDHYLVTADAAHGGVSEEIVITGVTNLNLGAGSNDFMFI